MRDDRLHNQCDDGSCIACAVDETIKEAIENCKHNGYWNEDISDQTLAEEFIEHGVFQHHDSVENLTKQIARVRASQ